VLGGLEHGAGIPSSSTLRVRTTAPPAREAMTVVASSGDPRARTFLRQTVQQENLSDDAVAIAIRALGQNFSTQQDAALLRSPYPRLHSEKSRDAVLSAVAEVGGAENVRWLIGLARNESELLARRRRALEGVSRAGAPIADLIALYDSVSDQGLKDALVSVYAQRRAHGYRQAYLDSSERNEH
jgi:HEAT repeat protein